MTKRDRRGRILAGHSLNPGGRPALPADLREAAQAHSSKAMTVLAEMLDDPDPRVRIRAAEVLLDRGYGKPTQQIDANVAQTIDTGRAHIEALLRLAREAKEPKLVVEHPPLLPSPDE